MILYGSWHILLPNHHDWRVNNKYFYDYRGCTCVFVYKNNGKGRMTLGSIPTSFLPWNRNKRPKK